MSEDFNVEQLTLTGANFGLTEDEEGELGIELYFEFESFEWKGEQVEVDLEFERNLPQAQIEQLFDTGLELENIAATSIVLGETKHPVLLKKLKVDDQEDFYRLEFDLLFEFEKENQLLMMKVRVEK